MRVHLKLALVASLAGMASGCNSDARLRVDGVTPGAGNAIASNTVMQMVDPWQDGVQDTRLRVPAARASQAGAADAAASAKDSQSTVTSN